MLYEQFMPVLCGLIPLMVKAKKDDAALMKSLIQAIPYQVATVRIAIVNASRAAAVAAAAAALVASDPRVSKSVGGDVAVVWLWWLQGRLLRSWGATVPLIHSAADLVS